MKALDRRALFTSGAAAALFASAGLSVAGTGPRSGGRLRAALSGASRADSWDIQKTSGFFMRAAAQGAVFDTLTEIGADGSLRGELATGWDGSADARTWVFDLRRKVVFHNGAPFGAQDVVASLRRHIAGGLLSEINEIRALAPHQVIISLHTGSADFPYLMSDPQLVIFPSDHLEEAMETGIGTGLYRVKRFLPGRQFLGLRVSEHYKDGQAGWFDSVEFVSVPDARIRAEALDSGYVDVADQIDSSGLSDRNIGKMANGEFHFGSGFSPAIGMPSMVGQRWAMDNARMAERWWMV